ncbi:restriction endonuclease subunit S [Geobacillus stearothermophilus]|uniref:Type I restriction-modification system, specificity subunit S n=1 Tax=Geobacillus stearothermophilus TaxID=1422 RepID=A0A150MZC1_GEOSE|nr:restriction endonuclease subunit S [Geobacillus stearothermophilus]KYD29786.1 Type I restriction-modification system, specificity subunit S [Geobacillus stearothermophilus]MED4871047.1 restriction endonuclease subunit S [Geobacillus stearothermophilus]MED4986197.1 restriction endonuclease subunit S [Geobacillus stearothermophilus]MED5043147.1 restriction endonuclease subunit S [Geobacillus stearothermophilus]
MNEWKEVRLGEVVQINPESLTKDYPFNVIDYIDISSVGTGELRETTQYPISEAPSRAKRLVRAGDTILSTVRPNRRSFLYLKKPKENQVVSTGFAVLRATEKINSRYLYYLISDQKFTDYLVSQEQGAAYPAVSIDSIKNAIVLLPDLETQEKIASILGSIDDKIELNVEMNKTLEEMAMTLYKHWFVDFGPFQDGEFVESELGMIPEGWECIEIGEAVSVLGGGTPKTSVKEYWENGDINWFSPTDLTTQKSLFISKSSKKITKLGLEKSSAKLFPPYCVMMTSRATIGEISINREEACTNQGFITLIPNETFTMYQLYFWLKTNMDLILSIANGSTFKEVSKTNFKKLKILKPKNIEEFTQKCEKLFKLIESNLIEIEELTNIKDYLLPRLLSGEIDVSKAEKQVEEVL